MSGVVFISGGKYAVLPSEDESEALQMVDILDGWHCACGSMQVWIQLLVVTQYMIQKC